MEIMMAGQTFGFVQMAQTNGTVLVHSLQLFRCGIRVGDIQLVHHLTVILPPRKLFDYVVDSNFNV